MRKILIVAGLLMGGALLAGTPAKAEVGCLCGKIGAPAVCLATVTACNLKYGGVCFAPCTYEPGIMGKRHRKHKKM